MNLAKRLGKLGTETAFGVAEEARTIARTGLKVYLFHLGDLDLKTPDHIIEAAVKAMNEGKTGYCSNYGVPELREALAAEINRSHGTSYSAANVAIQPGGKPVIQKYLLSLMNPGDGVLYPNPGYPIYESLIQFHGGNPIPYSYRDTPEGFRLDLDELEALIKPGTRFLVFNNYHNPTGAEATQEELSALSELVIRHDLSVLCDEAYFDIHYEGQSSSLVSFPGMVDRCVILYTFSKKFAMTGWRLGAAVGPREIVDAIAKLNVNDESCSNHFVQYAGLRALTVSQEPSRKLLDTLRARRDLSHELLSAIPGVRCSLPNSTFYLFPNVTALMERLDFDDYEGFRRDVLKATGVSFCTRLHFGTPLPGERERYIRFSYSGIDLKMISAGLKLFRDFTESRQSRASGRRA